MPERGSKTTMVSVVWTNLEFFGAIQMIFCRARLVTMDETWLYHCDPGTKQQSMEWRHSGSPRPNNFWGQKFAGKFSPWLFWIETASSSLSSKGPNYQRGILLISAGANEGYFEGNTPRGVHQGGLVLERQCHGSPATCNPEETGLPGLPMSWWPTLFSFKCDIPVVFYNFNMYSVQLAVKTQLIYCTVCTMYKNYMFRHILVIFRFFV